MTVISVENVSKAYRLGQIGGGTLKEDFARWCAKLQGKPDPTLKIGQEHHARHMGEQFWALDDVGNRMLFGGNPVRQPAFVTLKKQQPGAFRVVGDLTGADRIMNEAVFIGAYPGLTPAMMGYMIERITEFVRSK